MSISYVVRYIVVKRVYIPSKQRWTADSAVAKSGKSIVSWVNRTHWSVCVPVCVCVALGKASSSKAPMAEIPTNVEAKEGQLRHCRWCFRRHIRASSSYGWNSHKRRHCCWCFRQHIRRRRLFLEIDAILPSSLTVNRCPSAQSRSLRGKTLPK